MASLTTTRADPVRLSASTISSTTTNEDDLKASTRVQPKDKSSVRRWFSFVRKLVSSHNTQEQSECSTCGKKSEEFVAEAAPAQASSIIVIASSSVNEEEIEAPTKVEPTPFLRPVARSTPAPAPTSVRRSASAPAFARFYLEAVSEEATVSLTDASRIVEAAKVDDSTSPKPAKATRSREPRKPIMITPDLMKKIERDNRKRQGAHVRRAEVKKTSRGAVASASGAKGVRANPMRWSQD
ncbi:hypothetical protein J4E93_004318 [Alternaria ventricosa]|uniref:uncharacterized protein n=1 Tax=Alternaria ventricosa TaxID=1187951 RepID=UPI0020C307D9|nr:uncharacterized protein J4E93_004318 [Alternaria ventricosa]KAI4647907.1 hypothetical protein J4E93_004318 [Alternaria ventricosa]